MISREYYEERVARPGKFEGCKPWAPFFYDAMLDGCQDRDELDDDGTVVAVFYIGKDDTDIFPELKEFDEVQLWEDENGFIYCKEVKYAED